MYLQQMFKMVSVPSSFLSFILEMKVSISRISPTNSRGLHSGPGQWLLITPVAPASEQEMAKSVPDVNLKDSRPSVVREYEEYNGVQIFKYEKAFRKLKVKDENEFKDLWIRKIFLKTEVKFPAIHRSSEVISRTEYESRPIEVLDWWFNSITY